MIECENCRQELERKAKTLILLGVEMISVMKLQESRDLRSSLKAEMEDLLASCMPLFEEQYYESDGTVHPEESVKEIRDIVETLEDKIFEKNR